jgi:hypothetical protein
MGGASATGYSLGIGARVPSHTPSPLSPMARYISTIANTLGIATDRSRLVVGYLRSEYRTLDAISPAQIRSDY